MAAEWASREAERWVSKTAGATDDWLVLSSVYFWAALWDVSMAIRKADGKVDEKERLRVDSRDYWKVDGMADSMAAVMGRREDLDSALRLALSQAEHWGQESGSYLADSTGREMAARTVD